MAENMMTMKPVEVSLNKYGQRLDEYNEFGQSLEAEAWYFDAAVDVSSGYARAIERKSPLAQERTYFMTGNTMAMKQVEVGLNKYGQRLDEYNEFGQSLEAEAWYFDAAVDVSSGYARAIERKSSPAQEMKDFMAKSLLIRKPLEVALNKYGQRLDEYNEFGQSLEAEIWHFDGAVDVPVALVPALECLSRPAEKIPTAAASNTSLDAAHRRAA